MVCVAHDATPSDLSTFTGEGIAATMKFIYSTKRPLVGHVKRYTTSNMSLSTEATIAIVALLVSGVPGVLWVLHRMNYLRARRTGGEQSSGKSWRRIRLSLRRRLTRLAKDLEMQSSSAAPAYAINPPIVDIPWNIQAQLCGGVIYYEVRDGLASVKSTIADTGAAKGLPVFLPISRD